MRRILAPGALAATLILSLSLTGCDKKPEKPKDDKGKATTSVEPKSEEEKTAEKIAAAIAKLPEAERAVATAQKTCPVADEALGSMGPPYKVTVEGRDVYLCCEGCEGDLLKDPKKYFAKMDEAK